MKKLFLFLFAVAGLAAQSDAFIITIKTDNPGSSGSTSFTIPATGTGYNYEVDWDNDGVYDQWGSIAWSSMERAFFSCSNMTYNATDVPNLSAVTSMPCWREIPSRASIWRVQPAILAGATSTLCI